MQQGVWEMKEEKERGGRGGTSKHEKVLNMFEGLFNIQWRSREAIFHSWQVCVCVCVRVYVCVHVCVPERSHMRACVETCYVMSCQGLNERVKALREEEEQRRTSEKWLESDEEEE